MPSTNIPAGDPRAVKKFSVGLFTKLSRRKTFRGKMTGPVPKQGDAARSLRQETSSGYPIVEIRDLSKGAGDKVSVDIIDVVNGKPIMGDRRLAGRMMNLKFASQEITIDQTRGGVDPGGRMTQQRTVHELRMLSMANLEGWNNTLMDNLCQVHLAGARGYQGGRDWNVPFENDPDFNDVVVNTVQPPTENRRFIPGTGLGTTSDIDSSDTLTLETIEDLRTLIDESDYPLQGIRIEGDAAADDEEPMYCMYVSPRGYNQLRASSSAQDWNTLVSNAVSRGSIAKHPLFGSGDLMWRNILIKKSRRVIRIPSGKDLREYSGGSISTAQPGTDVDRAIVLGAQALGCAYGQHSRSRYYIDWHEEETDHGNRLEVSTSLMNGYRKLTFDLDGEKTDHGVWVVDHAAPSV
ncbi:N4-gp56 family major capsid protein [Algiphilus aromaticivorans]|uniref:N4-gp56 family major capsid protein n=1 Tax=Algiphilus aromaticivorans TaxID=382454 RepID=UPI000694C275|nr:N4-gp56 family major capsid protein [Algiphilus aromaticivorans]